MKKTHKDCSWLFKMGNFFYCCDVRGKLHGKALTEEDADKEHCEYFHEKEKKNKEKKYEQNTRT